ncbi:helix-turn-helix domain-containing protein [Enterococcus sp. LJL98]
MEINLSSAGQRIKQIREKHGYTMADLGKLVDANSPSTINNWEKGNNLPNKKRLEKIALLGGTSIEWIKYGEFSDYVSTLTQNYEKKILNYYGESTLNNYREALLDELYIEKITYEEDTKILLHAERIYTLLVNSKNNDTYHPVEFELTKNRIIDRFSNLTKKDFQTMCQALIIEMDPFYKKGDRTIDSTILSLSSMLFDCYNDDHDKFTLYRDINKIN